MLYFNKSSQNLHLGIVLFFVIFQVSCQQGALVTVLNDDYEFVDQGSTQKMLMSRDPYHRKDIYSLILQYKYNSAFILALQKPNYESTLSYLTFRIKTLDNQDTTRMLTDQESALRADSLIKNDLYYKSIFSRDYNLWIITKDSTYGPLDFNDYYNTRKRLGIPEGLHLEL